MVVGAATGPAEAAFKRTAANPTSTLAAAAHFVAYNTEVLGDSPYLYWRMDETSGTTINDATAANRDGTLLAQTYAFNQTGALTSETPNKAMGFTIASITGNNQVTPSGAFSVEAWVKTTSTTGGRFLGFGDANGQNPATKVDRQLYMAPNGKVYFGVGSAKTTVASGSAINNGAWHHVVGTYTSGTNGMKLYVDGVLQGSDHRHGAELRGVLARRCRAHHRLDRQPDRRLLRGQPRRDRRLHRRAHPGRDRLALLQRHQLIGAYSTLTVSSAV